MSGSSSGEPPGDSDDRHPKGRSADGSATPSEDPPRSAVDSDDVTIEDDGPVRWFLETDDEGVAVVRDVLSSVAIVAVVGLLLFGVSGIWPPLVAVESGSMEPNMQRGDLIFVVEEGRFAGDAAVAGTGVVTREVGQETGHEKFGNPGDVIVFRPDGDDRRTPVIHRAHFWVTEDENWVETKASEAIVGDATCNEVVTCPAPHDGFVTKGDHNAGYDQMAAGARTDVVKPEWVTGKAMVRIPWLGHVRLTFDRFLGGAVAPTGAVTGATAGGTVAGPAVPGPGSDGAVAGVTAVAGVGAAAAVAGGRRRD